MSTLTCLRAHPPQHTFDPALAGGVGNSKSIFSSFLPNLHGQGPIGSVVRIILKLHTSFTRATSFFSQESLGLGSKKKDEEMRGKAIKVIDLLQHSAELGNLDALFTLAQVSLVCLIALIMHEFPHRSHRSFHRHHTFLWTQNWHIIPCLRTLHGLGMQPRNPICPSSTPQDIKESHQWIKARPNCIRHSPQMVAIKVLKWHWLTVTGRVSGRQKAANAHWLGTGVQQNRVCSPPFMTAPSKTFTRVLVRSYEEVHIWTSWRPYFTSDSNTSVRFGRRYLWSRS